VIEITNVIVHTHTGAWLPIKTIPGCRFACMYGDDKVDKMY